MKFLKNRVLPAVCAFSILVSLCVVPVSAASFDDAYRDEYSVEYINAIFLSSYVVDGLDVLSALSQDVFPTVEDYFWSYVNKQVQTVGEVDMARLKTICQGYNSVFNTTLGDNFFSHAQNMADEIAAYTLAYVFFGEWGLTFELKRHDHSGLFRIYCPELEWWVTNSAGAYPYVDTNLSGSGGSQWLPFDMVYADIRDDSAKVALVDHDVLSAVCADLISSGKSCRLASVSTKYKGIVSTDGETIYGNADGYPYLAWASSDQTATEQERPPTTVVENGVVVEGDVNDNSTNINLDGMTVTLPDGSINIIDQIIYDESTKSYHIDSHDTYNYTVNNYYTWNYYINYTSVTYIGQTEEYNKYYEVYYELPDGRSSADLTKEDLEQLNVSVDVLPYTRAVDDVSLKSLYHFDGDTHDSSYWNYKTDFTWNSGASVTYMDAAVFEGALYLDETEHDFTFTLPCFVGSDFTLQWRYYQSVTAAPVTDSYLRFGSTDVLKFNGSQILNGSGTALCAMPIGSWNELCLTGNDGTVYFYVNGVKIATWTSTGYHSNQVNFHFGSEQQTFKYFDELRFLSKDLYGSGTAYTPTAVPHDTNLTLVLPDSENIVADEWVEWVGGADTTLVIDFTQGDALDDSGLEFLSDGTNFDVTFEMTEEGLLITRTDDSTGHVSSGAAGLLIDLGLLLPDKNCYHEVKVYAPSTGQYVYSYVEAQLANGGSTVSVPAVNGSSTGWRPPSTGEMSSHYDVILYPAQKSICVSRIEFAYTAGGSYAPKFSTPIRHSTVSAIDSESMHVPSLAVRTDLTITDYQIGGVRPSVPTKGLVWALVENQRITSIQIYNGQAWESCDGRIWTGERWIPASSYNIVTLQDMYDIVDSTPDYEYIYTESGFWSWWQKSWNAFQERLFKALGSGGTGAAGGCQHAYAITAETEATCTDPGERTYTCALCENQYVEPVPALGHDWIQKEETPTTYALPDGTACPDCAGLDYVAELDEDSATYSCTCNSCGTVWTVQAEVTEGETLYTCSRCRETTTETDKENEGFFDALGNFLADGVEWVTDKLKQLVDSLDGLNKIFSDYVTTIREKAGDYPAFLSAAISFMPEDLMAVFWFSVVAFVLLAVWKKWLR